MRSSRLAWLRGRSRAVALTACATLAGAQLSASRAHAGNDEGILIGGQAALTGGAVTATVSDGSAAWYNPAGLARIERQSFDVNASVYGISLSTADNLFTLPDQSTHGGSAVDWQLIPSLLSYARRLSARAVGAFSIAIPTTFDQDLRTSTRLADGTQWTLGVDELRNEYDYILSLGSELSPTLRVGVALHGIYISTEDMLQLGHGKPGAQSASFFTLSNHDTVSDYGARIGAGVQWSPAPRFDLGFALQTPTLTAFRSTRSTVITSLKADNSADGTYATSVEDDLSTVWELSTPLSIRFGAGYRHGRAQFLLDGSVYPPLDSSERSLARKTTGNARLACLYRLSDMFTLGAGVFTDLHGSRGPNPDFAGLAGGLRIAKNYQLREDDRPLSFLTTLGGRYAYGWAYTEGIAFRSDLDYATTRVRAHVNELAFNLTSGVTF